MTKYQETVENMKGKKFTEQTAKQAIASLLEIHLSKASLMPVSVQAMCVIDCVVDIICAVHEAGGDISLFRTAKDKMFREVAQTLGGEQLFDQSR